MQKEQMKMIHYGLPRVYWTFSNVEIELIFKVYRP